MKNSQEPSRSKPERTQAHEAIERELLSLRRKVEESRRLLELEAQRINERRAEGNAIIEAAQVHAAAIRADAEKHVQRELNKALEERQKTVAELSAAAQRAEDIVTDAQARADKIVADQTRAVLGASEDIVQFTHRAVKLAQDIRELEAHISALRGHKKDIDTAVKQALARTGKVFEAEGLLREACDVLRRITK